MVDINPVSKDHAHAEQSEWQTAWTRLPDGGLRHCSGLSFNVVNDATCHDEVRVDLTSLEAWETFELQGGLGLLNLPLRRERLTWEAREFLTRRSH